MPGAEGGSERLGAACWWESIEGRACPEEGTGADVGGEGGRSGGDGSRNSFSSQQTGVCQSSTLIRTCTHNTYTHTLKALGVEVQNEE